MPISESSGSIEVRPAGNTYHVYIDGNIGGTFMRHVDAGGTPYFNTYVGGREKHFATEEEVTAAVVKYYRTGS